VAQILDRDTGAQCATLRLRCMPGQFGRYVHRLCRWYNDAQIALERTGAGVGSLEALLDCGYSRSLMYHRSVSPDQDPQVRTDYIGWNSDEISRQQLISALDEAIRQGNIFVHDPITIQELQWFVINPRGKAEAQPGCHDDCVIALALAVVVMARMPRPLPAAESLPAPRFGYYGKRSTPEPTSRGRIVKVRLGEEWMRRRYR
jgi:phage terminase large subunit